MLQINLLPWRKTAAIRALRWHCLIGTLYVAIGISLYSATMIALQQQEKTLSQQLERTIEQIAVLQKNMAHLEQVKQRLSKWQHYYQIVSQHQNEARWQHSLLKTIHSLPEYLWLDKIQWERNHFSLEGHALQLDDLLRFHTRLSAEGLFQTLSIKKLHYHTDQNQTTPDNFTFQLQGEAQ